jgi:hypothetical protein
MDDGRVVVKPLTLSRVWRAQFDEALDPYSLTEKLRHGIEMCLTDFAVLRPRATPEQERALLAKHRTIIDCASTLLRLIPTVSAIDDLQPSSENCGTRFGPATLTALLLNHEPDSVMGRRDRLVEELATRLPKWQARHEKLLQYQRRSQRAHRSKDLDRYALVFWTMQELDRGGISDSLHTDGARVRTLRLVLQIADWIDNRPMAQGNLRLIREVGAAYRDQNPAALTEATYRGVSRHVSDLPKVRITEHLKTI